MTTSLSHTKTLDIGEIGILDEQLPPWDSGPLDLAGWFDPDRRDCPLELEIGSGKGTFLVNQADQTPGTNYIGIEYAKQYWRHAADRCRRHQLTNVKVVRTEADLFVRRYTPPESLRQTHIYFPDPWPKPRHNKRRLIQESFLRSLHTATAPSGLVRIVTDHPDYYEWIEHHADRVADLWRRLPFECPQAAGPGELVGSNFERKYRRQGRPFHAMILEKYPAT